VVTDMERNCTCINGHLFTAVGTGDEPDQAMETYVIRTCPVCEMPTDIKWPLNRSLEVIPNEPFVESPNSRLQAFSQNEHA
jgi:hypothetical protein